MSNGNVLWVLIVAFLVINAIFLYGFGNINAEDEEDEPGDLEIFGLEAEKFLSFVNGVLALILFIITFMAFTRDRRDKFLYVSIAFLLFAIRSFLEGWELFGPEIPLVDPIAVGLDFIILLTFFFGLLKK